MTPSYMPYYFEVKGTLAFESPFHTGAGTNWSPLTDAPLYRLDGDPAGPLALPGASIRGALRSLLRREASLLNLSVAAEQLFGDTDQIGRLTVFDSIQTGAPAHNSQIRDHVRIDRATGAAAQGAKFDEEVKDSLNLTFSFRLIYQGDGPADPELTLLKEGLLRLQEGGLRLGGKSSRGYGHAKLTDANVLALHRGQPDDLASYAHYRATHQSPAWKSLELSTATAPATSPGAEPPPSRAQSFYDFEILLRFDGPLLVKALPVRAKPLTKLASYKAVVQAADHQTRLHNLAALVTDPEAQRAAADFVPFESSPDVVCLPGSSIRGVLRSQAFRICDAAAIGPELATALFGSARGPKKNQQGSKSLIEIGDARLDGAARPIFLDHVAIDRITGFAAGKMKFAQCALDSPDFVFRARLSAEYKHLRRGRPLVATPPRPHRWPALVRFRHLPRLRPPPFRPNPQVRSRRRRSHAPSTRRHAAGRRSPAPLGCRTRLELVFSTARGSVAGGPRRECLRMTLSACRNQVQLCLETEYLLAADAVRAEAFVQSKLAALGRPAIQLVQTIAQLTFDVAGPGPWVKGSASGRLFGPDAEVRWTQDGSAYRLWFLTEIPATPDAPPLPPITPKRYYLLGRVQQPNGDFRETHLPQSLDSYYEFLHPGAPTLANQRPYIGVVEYFAPAPAPTCSRTDFEAALNQPSYRRPPLRLRRP